MKRVAQFLALLWWAQTPLCLLAADAHAHASVEAAAAGESHHGHGAPAPFGPAGEGPPRDPSCAEHCASLLQALPVQAATSAASPAAWVALALEAAAMAPAPPQLSRAVEAARQPPPDPSRHSSVLRL